MKSVSTNGCALPLSMVTNDNQWYPTTTATPAATVTPSTTPTSTAKSTAAAAVTVTRCKPHGRAAATATKRGSENLFYRVCDQCGATLDPGERCDCQDKEKAAPDVTSIQDGKGEK